MLSTSSRLLRLLSLLQSRRHWSGAALAAEMGVHARTLRRDIDRLRELGYPIQASSGVAGGYAFRAGRALPPLMLDDEEALAAALALRTAVTGTISGIEQTAITALVKLEQVMPPRLRRRLDALRTAIVPTHPGGPVVDAGLLGVLAGACRDQLQLRFDYADRNGVPSHRQVEPQGVVHAERRWYLVAWDTAREDWRTFRIDRITGAPQQGVHFRPRPAPGDGDLGSYVKQILALPSHAVEARVVLHAPLAAMRQRVPATLGVLEGRDADTCVLRCAEYTPGLLEIWLIMLEVEFEVLDPPELRQHLQQTSARLLRGAAYAGPPARPVTRRKP
ncbi:WYL domain-containing protein [Stenotrophomonas sp. PS02289]|uniref:helix-turn-helix transcriptional regulator n=1 Tax=Stenotrophomonas sp. PS02289 TaxID=2991422 RepID=UPI00249B34B6|nr:WYL domain-containing protein [Stenotrophomonas sp. PS02289]